MNDINDYLAKNFKQDISGVWVLDGHSTFDYSDGLETEHYIGKVIAESDDICSTSSAIESHIIDWPSEYHLSHKRAQLLKGLSFDTESKVLEIGCGCGAITRYLAEKYDEVVAIEGSLNRARIARSRVRDMENVTVICAPFQEVLFPEKFDLVFCVGVFEYSANFFSSPDPYSFALASMRENLNENGSLILAIENRLGVKYFAGHPEDHVGYAYEGLNGYPFHGDRVQTFGRSELESMLRECFAELEWLYPFPDYKVPTCIVSHDFLAKGFADQMISQVLGETLLNSPVRGGMSMRLMTLQLGKNGLLPDLSNSFLVVASCKNSKRKAFQQKAILYSTSRRPQFCTETRVVNNGLSFRAKKSRISNSQSGRYGSLSHQVAESEWHAGHSLHTTMLMCCRRKDFRDQLSLMGLGAWCNYVKSSSCENGLVPGELIDAIWSNVFIENGKCEIIDKEWVWNLPIKFEVLFIRAAYWFLRDANALDPKDGITKYSSGREQIEYLGDIVSVKMSKRDFEDFIKLESDFAASALGANLYKAKFQVHCFLWGPRYLVMAKSLVSKARFTWSTITRVIRKSL